VEQATVQVHAVGKVRKSHHPKGGPFLKPHPTVSALECASSLQYTVGTLGEGKRAYVDDDSTWKHVPTFLLGRPVIVTAVEDQDSKGTFISLFVDEPSDVYVLLPAAQETRKAKAAAHTQTLSWLPFKLPSLLGDDNKETAEEKDDIPSWMEDQYHVVPDFTGILSDGEKFDVWRKNLPVLGFLELGGNEGKTKGATRGMYVAVLVPAAGSMTNITVQESLPIGFPRNLGGVEEEGGLDNGGPETGEGGNGPLDWRGDGAHQGRQLRLRHSLAHAKVWHSREPAGSRGRFLARHGKAVVAGGGRHTLKGRQAIFKALTALKQRLAQSRKQTLSLQKTPDVTRGGASIRRRVASGAKTVPAFENSEAPARLSVSRQQTAGHATQRIRATDLVDMVKRCGSKNEAGRCLVRAQACMSARTMADPANCKCFADAVESFSIEAPAALCRASCMSAVQEAYDSHVKLVTGKPSPCI